MLEFLKGLFGRKDASASSTQFETDRPRLALSRYFELSTEIQQAKSDGNFAAAIQAARSTYRIFPEVIAEWELDGESWEIPISHAVHTAAPLMAVMQDRAALVDLRATVQSHPALRKWLPDVDSAEADLAIVGAVVSLIESEPGVLQNSVRARLGLDDGKRVAQLLSWLEKGKRIRRIRKGSTYLLYPAEHKIVESPAKVASSRASAVAPVGLPVERARGRTRAATARPMEPSSVPFLRLPKAPAQWEERSRQHESDLSSSDGTAEPAPSVTDDRPAQRRTPRFAVRASSWRLTSEEKLAGSERPDPAFKTAFPASRYTHWLDPKGHREGYESAAAVLRVTNDSGAVHAERGLEYDVYRSDVNEDGTGILFMSRDGVLHAYAERLDALLLQSVEDLPEYRAQASRLGIDKRELKNHVRCVAISNDRSRYIITVVDEAWCLTVATSEVIWGLRFPIQTGWRRVATARSERFGTSAEISEALQLMQLTLPVSTDDIVTQYRRLAMRWHPDRNPNDPGATRRFQQLAAAMELLSGVNPELMSGAEIETVTYERLLHREVVETSTGGSITLSMTMAISEKSAADWIYAANFASDDGHAFLAGYSGIVVEVSADGLPLRAYDIGAVPRQIVRTREHLYILTDTRLYVLENDRLAALVDVFEKGRLIVGDTGFGLLESKAFTWFAPDGTECGQVTAKDPIRRVMSAPDGLIVETRQHRARIAGAPDWWRAKHR